VSIDEACGSPPILVHPIDALGGLIIPDVGIVESIALERGTIAVRFGNARFCARTDLRIATRQLGQVTIDFM
jgi:hypothetical protein